MAAMDAGDAGQDAARDAREDVPADRLTVAEAARQLGISTAALRKRIKRGTLPALKVGEQWYVTREGVDAARAAARSAAPDTGSPSGGPVGPNEHHSPGTGQGPDAAYDAGRDTPDTGRDGEVRRLEEQVALLHEEVNVRRREVQQLHTLLAQAQQLALPPPATSPDFHQASQDTWQDSQDERQGERQDTTPLRRAWWKFW